VAALAMPMIAALALFIRLSGGYMQNIKNQQKFPDNFSFLLCSSKWQLNLQVTCAVLFLF